jgi:membrane-associated phospholipid phosphatase
MTKKTYSLKGRQVQPDAASWLPPKLNLSIPTLQEIKAAADPLVAQHPFPDDLEPDLRELHMLATLRDDPSAVASTDPARPRRPVSSLLLTQPAPYGAVVSKSAASGSPQIQTGRHLARYFEAETPGLPHTHALNMLFSTRGDFSPPRQAQVWAVLQTAIYAALLAAWHYKWNDPLTANQPRPIEVDPTISELYSFSVLPDGSRDGGPVRNPDGAPGTPRHPTYPSGHSTVGGAASEVLSHYFPELRAPLDDLADNSGLARMWAGIHYRADHEFGVSLGRAVAKLVITRSV